jgi:hypothetical protein
MRAARIVVATSARELTAYRNYSAAEPVVRWMRIWQTGSQCRAKITAHHKKMMATPERGTASERAAQ